MLFFKNMTITNAALWSAVIMFISAVIMFVSAVINSRYFSKNKEYISAKVNNIKKLLSIGYIITILMTGFLAANAATDLSVLATALSHNMTVDKETGKYEVIMKDADFFNKNSMKETKIKDINELKNQIIIFTRYDCIDCAILHSSIASLDNVIFLSSRSITGKEAREKYDITLTEVPQGVYIDENGNSVVVSITTGDGEDLRLDIKQVEKLYDMKK